MNDRHIFMDIDFGLQCVGFCVVCEAPIMENEMIFSTEAGLRCEECICAQEEND